MGSIFEESSFVYNWLQQWPISL